MIKPILFLKWPRLSICSGVNVCFPWMRELKGVPYRFGQRGRCFKKQDCFFLCIKAWVESNGFGVLQAAHTPPQLTSHVPVYSCWGKLEEFICCQLVLNLRLVFISASKTAPSAFHLLQCWVLCCQRWLRNMDISPSGSWGQKWAQAAFSFFLFFDQTAFHNDLYVWPVVLCCQLTFRIPD